MIVNRMEWRIKMGMVQGAVKLLREEDNAGLLAAPFRTLPARIYTSMFGPVSRVAIEWNYASMSEKDAANEAWQKTGRVPAFQAKSMEVRDRNLSNTIFNLHSSHTVEDSKNTIAIRWIIQPIALKWVEYMELLDKWIVKTGKYTARVMHPTIGENRGVVLEMEFANMNDYYVQFQEWNSQPGIESYWKTYNELATPKGSITAWNLMP